MNCCKCGTELLQDISLCGRCGSKNIVEEKSDMAEVAASDRNKSKLILAGLVALVVFGIFMINSESGNAAVINSERYFNNANQTQYEGSPYTNADRSYSFVK